MRKSPDKQVADAIRKAVDSGKPVRIGFGGGLYFFTLKGPRMGRWVYKGRVAGKGVHRDVTLGYWATGMRYQTAVKARDDVRLAMSDGVDPSTHEPGREDVREVFGGVAACYFQARLNAGQSSHNIGIEDSRVKRYLTALADRPVKEIGRKELRDLVRSIADEHGGNLARRIAGIIARVLAFAEDEGLIDTTPAHNLTRGIIERAKGEEGHFAAATTPEDAAAVYAQIWKDTHEDHGDAAFALRVLTLMPVRVSSLLSAKWQDLTRDGEGNFVAWTFPNTKNGRHYTYPVAPALNLLLRGKLRQAILQSRDRSGEGGYVFQGRDPDKPLTARALGLRFRTTGVAREAQTLHGMRATFQTILANQGAPLSCIEEALGHVLPSRTQRAYFRGCDDARMMELFTTWQNVVFDWLEAHDVAIEMGLDKGETAYAIRTMKGA